MEERTLRRLVQALGVGTLAFGLVPFASPKLFSRLFGLKAPSEPTVEAAFRSVGARDIALGMGIWFAATRSGRSGHGGSYAPWVLARMFADIGDTIAALIAIRRGERDPRFLALMGMAAGAAAFDGWLWTQTRAATAWASTSGTSRDASRRRARSSQRSGESR